jgi:hypothetical protein
MKTNLILVAAMASTVGAFSVSVSWWTRANLWCDDVDWFKGGGVMDLVKTKMGDRQKGRLRFAMASKRLDR